MYSYWEAWLTGIPVTETISPIPLHILIYKRQLIPYKNNNQPIDHTQDYFWQGNILSSCIRYDCYTQTVMTICFSVIQRSTVYYWIPMNTNKWFTLSVITYFMCVFAQICKNLPDGELNPGLPRDRRGYSPLYYRGPANTLNILLIPINPSHNCLWCTLGIGNIDDRDYNSEMSYHY